MSESFVASEGDHAMADIDVCCAVSEDLNRHYPGHAWVIGCDHNAGTVAIDIAMHKPPALKLFGYLLHLSTIMGAGGQAAVMRAGGELLERYGLQRRGARVDDRARAIEHGLDVDGSKDGEYWKRKHGVG